MSISSTDKLFRFLNPDSVGGILFGIGMSFDLFFDFKAFFANGYELSPGKRGVDGGADADDELVLDEAVESDSAKEGRGGGVSYKEGPVCIRR